MTGIAVDQQIIFTSADARYMPGAIVSLYSALLQSSVKTFIVVTSAPHSNWLSQSVYQMFEDRGAKLHIVESSSLPLDTMQGTTNRFPPEAFARFFVHHLPYGEAVRALYIDSDVMVPGKLDPLFKFNLERSCIGAVPNINAIAKGKLRQLQERIGLSPQYVYLNSGVLVIDIPRYRQSSLLSQISEVLDERAGQLSYPDQDALNLADRALIKTISPRYNFPPGLWRFLNDDERAGISILHFYDGNKPWNSRAHRVPKDILMRYDALAKNLGLSNVISANRPKRIGFHSQVYTQKFWIDNLTRSAEARRAIETWQAV